MNTNQFLEYSKKLEIAAEILSKGATAFTGIQWEKDVTKINLSVLSSAPILPDQVLNYPYTKLSIEHVPLKEVYCDRELNLDAEIERFIPLYELVSKGVGIIPPTVFKNREMINGEAVGGMYPIHLCDGNHRVQIAKALKLESIPILFIDTVSAFRFSSDLFAVEANQENNLLRFTNKNTGEIFILDLQDVYPVVDGSGDWVFHVNLY